MLAFQAGGASFPYAQAGAASAHTDSARIGVVPNAFPSSGPRIQVSTADSAATGPVTRLLSSLRDGRTDAWDDLLPLVYQELRELASQRLRYEHRNHTLNTTALVHEAYVRLVDQRWAGVESRTHFLAVAAQAMRRILVSYARARNSDKRGGGVAPLSLDQTLDPSMLAWCEDQGESLLVLDDLLRRLEQFNPRGCRVVEYRFFGGLTYDEVAEVMDISSATVRRAWTLAKAWLQRELRDVDLDS